jgi:hypothetical protein
MKKSWPCIVVICFFLSGCGAKSNVVKPYQFDSNLKLNFSVLKNEPVEIPSENLETIQKKIQEGLSEKNLLATNDDKKYRKAEILITSYRMRPDAARLIVGIMAGCDNIKSNVVITDPETNNKIGESEISIEECAAWGVSSQVIAAYSKEVVNYLTGKK